MRVCRAARDQLLAQQRRQRRRVRRIDRRERPVPEHMADHAGLLQRAAARRGGRPSSRACSTPVSVGGTRVASSRSGMHASSPRAGLDGALVDQHLDQLFHVERVALGAAGDELAQRRRALRRSCCSSSSASSRLRVLVERLRGRCAGGRVAVAPSRRGARTASAASAREHEQRHVAVDLAAGSAGSRAISSSAQCRSSSTHDDRPAVAARCGAGSCAAAWKARLRICRGSSRMPCDVRARREVEADQVAEQVRMALARSARRRRRAARCPSSSLRARSLDAVAVGDLQAPGEHVAQQAVGLALGLRGWRGREAASRFGPRSPSACSNSCSSRLLPRPASADDGDGAQRALGERPRRRRPAARRARRRGRSSASARPRCRAWRRETRAAWRARTR